MNLRQEKEVLSRHFGDRRLRNCWSKTQLAGALQSYACDD